MAIGSQVIPLIRVLGNLKTEDYSLRPKVDRNKKVAESIGLYAAASVYKRLSLEPSPDSYKQGRDLLLEQVELMSGEVATIPCKDRIKNI